MQNYGVLLNSNAKLYRRYFNEMIKLIGINVIYRSPKQSKHWTTYAEIESNYEEPLVTGCIFSEHPTQYTMKKLGWVSELQDSASIITVPYDLPNLSVGALFVVPSGIDNAEGRLFRVSRISTTMMYPDSVTCEIVPEYKDTFIPSLYNHTNNSFNLLNEEGDGNL